MAQSHFSTTSQNVGFIERPSFGSSLEENVDDYYIEDDEFGTAGSIDEDLLPNFKTVVLNGASSSVKWTKSPKNDETKVDSNFDPSKDCDSVVSDSSFNFSKFLRSDDTAKQINDDYEAGLPGNPEKSGIEKFYDFKTCQWVNVENFAFAGDVNHFSDQSDPPTCDDDQPNVPFKNQEPIQPTMLPEVNTPASTGDHHPIMTSLPKGKEDHSSASSSIIEDESSLALLDPKYLARMDSTDIFGFNTTACDDVMRSWSPLRTSKSKPEEVQRNRNSLTKQLSLHHVDDKGDKFRPQGASSPLLEPLEESDISHPSSLEYDEALSKQQPKIISPRDCNKNFRRKSSEESRISTPSFRRKSSDEKTLSPHDRRKTLDSSHLSTSFHRKSVDEKSSFRRKSSEESQNCQNIRNSSKPMRKLSNDLGTALPSRSDPSTPKSSDVSFDGSHVADQQQQVQQLPQQQQQQQTSKIPRFIRNSSRSHSSGSSPIERKLKQHQVVEHVSNPDVHQDRAAKKLGHKKSHSVDNLNRISVRDYHSSRNQLCDEKFASPSTARKSLSYDNIQRAKSFTTSESITSGHATATTTTTTAGPKLRNKTGLYDHVQSKVRKYIDGYSNSRAGSVGRTTANEEDFYGRSFILSPGRKSLSMSNLTASAAAQASASRRPSQSNLIKMKTFLSSRNLNGVQITISGARLNQGREGLHSNEVPLDTSRISRLLDNLSDDEVNDFVQRRIVDDAFNVSTTSKNNVDPISNENLAVPIVSSEDDIVVDVEDLLQLALDERKGKQEAKQVLCQLQANYDQLQRRYAQAENIIDKLRFGSTDVGAYEAADSAFVDPTTALMSSRVGGSTYQAASTLNSLNLTESRGLPITTSRSQFNITVQRQNSGLEKLKEIQEQIYGLELLVSTTSSLTSMEKKKILDHLRASFDDISSNANVNSSGEMLKDEAFVRLLTEVGRKLFLMEARERSGSFDDRHSIEAEFALPQVVNLEIEKKDEGGGFMTHMGPIEKVAKWRETQTEDPVAHVNSNLPSCYGSCPTSPTTGSGSREALDQQTSDRQQQRKSFDFDSGCPGSDRSSRNPIRKSPPTIHPLSTDRYHLFNVEEKEEKSSNVESAVDALSKSPVATDRSRKSADFATLKKDFATTRTRTGVPTLRLQRESFHSVTDLSSDEQSNADNFIRSTKSSPRRHRPDVLMVPTPPSVTSSQNVTPRGANAILASQIDQEIIELRNLYEHHREEMMNLASKGHLVQSKPTLQQHTIDTQTMPFRSPTKQSRMFANRQSAAKCFESESDSVDLSLQEERRIEFQQRRRLRQLQKKRHPVDDVRHRQSGNDVIRNNKDVLVQPKFAIGSVTSPVAQNKNPGISSFFPPVCSAEPKNHPVSSLDVADGRRVALADGDEVFIPKLDLEELVSEGSENFGGPRLRDPRSFDFNQSLDQAEEAALPGRRSSNGKVISSNDGSSTSSLSRTRRRICSLTDQGCQVNENSLFDAFPLNGIDLGDLRRTVSAGHLRTGPEMTPRNGSYSNRPIIIVQRCCGGHGISARSCRSERSATEERPATSSDIRRHHPDHRESERKLRHRKKKEELQKLLVSLSQANELATKLKLRSAEMLEMIGQDMNKLHSAAASKF